jgi:tetratricopeptide (TPR) repeat protein
MLLRWKYFTVGILLAFNVSSKSDFKKIDSEEEYKSLLSQKIDSANYYLQILNNQDSAMHFAKDMLTMAEYYFDSSNYVTANILLGNIKRRYCVFDESKIYLNEAKLIADKLGDLNLIMETRYALGNVYWEGEEMELSFASFFEALDIAIKLKNNLKQAVMLRSIANLYNIQKDHSKSKEYYERSIDIFEAVGDSGTLCAAYSSLGDVLIRLGEFDKAEEVLSKAKDLIRIKKGRNEFIWTMRFAHLKNEQGELRTAQKVIKTLINENKDINVGLMADALEILARINYDLGHYDASIEVARKSMKFFKDNKIYSVQIELLSIIEKSLIKLGRSQEAITVLDQILVTKDSAFISTKSAVVNKLNADFELASKEREIELFQAQQDLNIAEIQNHKSNQRYLLLAGIGLLAIFILTYSKYRSKQNSNIILEQNSAKIKEQKDLLEKERNHTQSSIESASDIQKIILTEESELQKVFSDSFVLFLPKDIVSGDFYMYINSGDKDIVVLADCTGHGVPGALTSMMGS